MRDENLDKGDEGRIYRINWGKDNEDWFSEAETI